MKKGFTLIELLAVIVVIVIIALISLPIILNVIKNSEKGALKDSMYGVVNAANLYYSNNIDENIIGKYDLDNKTILFKGKIDNGYVYYDNDGEVSALIYKGKYCAYKYPNTDVEIGVIKSGKCVIDNKEVDEEILVKIDIENDSLTGDMHGTEPVLKDNLIAVTIESDGTVKKADTEKEWYNYYEKEWANAVILKDESVNYSNNEVIPESNIESYFVWIPRFKYKLWNTKESSLDSLVKSHTIEIKLESKDTTPSNGTNNGEWLTHPAFTSFNSNGFWVGKFEIGYNSATSSSSAEVVSADSTKIIIKPNVFSWRNNTVYNYFVSSYNYERNLDSHMMKNTEWGAVAYLSHSKFGIDREVNINNNSSYKTGYSALLSTNQQTYPGEYGDGVTYNQLYNTDVGYLASTTGNITGVYDMNGGTVEYMASHINGNVGSSGFTSTTINNYNQKYFDIYNTSCNINTYQYRILGDATGEMGPFKNYLDNDGTSRWHNSWYNDYSYFIESNNPWFNRGGYNVDGGLSGQFNFSYYSGGSRNFIGSRLVLTP